MKTKFSFLLALVFAMPIVVSAQKYTREFHGEFQESLIKSLDISNKFGTIEINDFGGNMVTVDAVIVAEKMSEKKANELFDKIKIEIARNGNVLKVQTIFSSNFQNKGGSFSINYKINIPRDRDLNVSNKYGNVVVKDVDAKCSFVIAYGNITAGDLTSPGNSPVILDLSYGNANIGSTNSMNGNIKYSNMTMDSSNNIVLESKYSKVTVNKALTLELESKYDGITLKDIETIAANSKYSSYSIGLLQKGITLSSGYGHVRIDEVNPVFENIDINSSYGGITLGMDNLSFNLDAECSYCDIKYPSGRFTGNHIRENNQMRVVGRVGSESSGGKVFIRSRYGDIKLGN